MWFLFCMQFSRIGMRFALQKTNKLKRS
jgi:hypothetical protein